MYLLITRGVYNYRKLPKTQMHSTRTWHFSRWFMLSALLSDHEGACPEPSHW